MNSQSPDPTEPPRDSSGFRESAWIAILVVFAVVALAAGWRLAAPKPAVHARQEGHDGRRRLAAFNLTERSGRAVTEAELQNRFLVVNFVFTSCSVSCLQVNRSMEEIQRLTAAQPDVRLVSITIDPRTDTPAVLAKFADRFGADTNRWLFLTGDKASVYALLETSFLERDERDPMNLAPGGFVGMELIAVVDRDGCVLAYVNGLRDDAAREVVRRLAELRLKSHAP